MSYTFEKHYTETFVVTQISLGFLRYDNHFRKIRSDIKTCGFCGHKFEDREAMNLALMENKANQLICDSCADVAENGGADVFKGKYYRDGDGS